MFSDAYRVDREEKASRASFIVPDVQFTSQPSLGTKTRLAFAGVVSLQNTHLRAADSSAEPTTTPPMSSEHSFMATSVPPSQPPPPLAAQPGGIPPYVPAILYLGGQESSAHCRQERGRSASDTAAGAPIVPPAAREQGLRE